LQKQDFSTVLIITEMLTKGSEAFIYSGEFLGKKAIIKERRPKKYRHPKLDMILRTERIKLETRILNAASNSSIPVPAVLGAYPEKFILILEFIEGKPLGKFLEENLEKGDKKIKDFFFEIGMLTGKLHELNIIHGDLTIHNILVRKNDLILIDFGLSFITDDIEPFATDLYTFESALRAYTPKEVGKWVTYFLEGYKKSYSKANLVLQQFQDILSRGRYIKRNPI
jgi:TP53 regulating kinase-like protein